MKCIFVEIERVELDFFLFPDDVDEKIEKKFKSLGLPAVGIEWPTDKSIQVESIEPGVYRLGEYERTGISIYEATDDSDYSISYNSEACSLRVCLSGKFFCYNDMEVPGFSRGAEFLDGQSHGYIYGILPRDLKRKEIKKKKDIYGISSRLEALAVKAEYDDLHYRVKFKVIIEDGLYSDGKIQSSGY